MRMSTNGGDFGRNPEVEERPSSHSAHRHGPSCGCSYSSDSTKIGNHTFDIILSESLMPSHAASIATCGITDAKKHVH